MNTPIKPIQKALILKYPLLLISFLFFIISTAYTQHEVGTYKMEFGPEFQFKKTWIFEQFLGSARDSLMTYATFADKKHEQLVLRQFDDKLKPTDRELLLNNYDHSKCRSLGLLRLPNSTFHFLVKKRINDITYYVQKIDLNSMSKGPNIKLFTIETEEYEPRRLRQFVAQSKNDSLLAFYYSIPKKRKESKEFRVHLFDHNMNSISEHQYNMDFSIREFELRNTVLSNDSILYIRARVHDTDPPKNSKPGLHYDFRLMQLKHGEILELNRSFTSARHVGASNMGIKDSDLIVSGYYGLSGKESIRGYFFQRFDVNKREMRIDTVALFPHEYFLHGLKKKQRKRRIDKLNRHEYEDRRFRFLKIFDISEDQIILASEKSKTEAGSSYVITDKLALAALDDAGNLNWHQKVDKNNAETLQDAWYASYLAASHEDHLYCFYNTNKYAHSEQYISPELRSSFGSLAVAVAKVNLNTGQTDYDIIIKQPELKGKRLLTRTGFKNDANQLVLYLHALSANQKSRLVRIVDTANDDTNVNPK